VDGRKKRLTVLMGCLLACGLLIFFSVSAALWNSSRVDKTGSPQPEAPLTKRDEPQDLPATIAPPPPAPASTAPAPSAPPQPAGVPPTGGAEYPTQAPVWSAPLPRDAPGLPSGAAPVPSGGQAEYTPPRQLPDLIPPLRRDQWPDWPAPLPPDAAGAPSDLPSPSARMAPPPPAPASTAPAPSAPPPVPEEAPSPAAVPSDIFKEIHNALSRLVTANAIWRSPPALDVEQSQLIGLAIGNSDELTSEINQMLPNTNETAAGTVKVAPQAKARLLVDPNDADVTPNGLVLQP
jgi:hypothetical protein